MSSPLWHHSSVSIAASDLSDLSGLSEIGLQNLKTYKVINKPYKNGIFFFNEIMAFADTAKNAAESVNLQHLFEQNI